MQVAIQLGKLLHLRDALSTSQLGFTTPVGSQPLEMSSAGEMTTSIKRVRQSTHESLGGLWGDPDQSTEHHAARSHLSTYRRP